MTRKRNRHMIFNASSSPPARVAVAGLKTSCDFNYGGMLIEMMLLGLAVYRVGKTIEYDAENGRVTNSPEGNDFLRREYRDGWALNG